MDSFVEGFKLMIPAVAILIFAWSLKGMGDALGIADFVGGIVGANASASVAIPAIKMCIRDSLISSRLTQCKFIFLRIQRRNQIDKSVDCKCIMLRGYGAELLGRLPVCIS